MDDGLHDDILTEILLRVPASSLMQSKWTCKRWHALISHPTFVYSHLERSRKDPASRKILKTDILGSRSPSRGPVEFARVDSENLESESRLHVPTARSFPPIVYVYNGGTCDGLVCLVLRADCGDKSCRACEDIICLWNPSTGEFRELPNLHNCCSVPDGFWAASGVGVGYDCVADDYKVVALASREFQHVRGKNPAHIWARKTGAWKRVSDSHMMDSVRRGPVYSKGAVHWMAHRINEQKDTITSHVILSFGFAKEEFQELPISEHIPSSRWDDASIGTLDGCLCVITRPLPYTVETWIMKETSWSKMFSISIKSKIPRGLVSGYVELVTLRNGKILILSCLKSPAFLYHLEDKTSSRPRWGYRWSRGYEESLVSPYSCVDGCKLEEVVTSPSCRGSLQPLGIHRSSAGDGIATRMAK